MNETQYQDPDEIFKDIDLSEDEGAPKYIGEEQSKLKSKRKRFRSTLRNMASGLKFDNFGFNLGNKSSTTIDNLDLPIVCKNKYFSMWVEATLNKIEGTPILKLAMVQR